MSHSLPIIVFHEDFFCHKFPLKSASKAWPSPITKPPAQTWEVQQVLEAPDSLQACHGTGPGKHHQTSCVWRGLAARSQETGPHGACAQAEVGMPGAVHLDEVCLQGNSYYKLALLMLTL